MMEQAFATLRGRLKDRMDQLVDATASGMPPDFAAYRQLVGAMNELKRVFGELDEVEKLYLDQ